MKITEFTASYERTVQLERFEPIRVSESITVALEPDDDLDEVRRELDHLLNKSVERRILRRTMQKKLAEGEADDE
jgi:hypothetical protein